jgi:hypothetical protein
MSATKEKHLRILVENANVYEAVWVAASNSESYEVFVNVLITLFGKSRMWRMYSGGGLFIITDSEMVDIVKLLESFDVQVVEIQHSEFSGGTFETSIANAGEKFYDGSAFMGRFYEISC